MSKRNCIYVNNVDIFATYGVFMLEGGYNDLVTMPSTKDVTTNEWAEYAGAEVDLTDMKLAKREISIRMCSVILSEFARFSAFLRDGGVMVWQAQEIAREWHLRYLSMQNVQKTDGICTFTLKMAWDSPAEHLNGQQKRKTIYNTYKEYSFDNVPLTDYNIVTLQGTANSTEQRPSIKANFEQDCRASNGIRWGGLIKQGTRDIKLRCLMRAANLSDLWNNYDALLAAMVSNGGHTIKRISDGAIFNVYYKSCAVNSFFASGKIWIDFTLIFCQYEYL